MQPETVFELKVYVTGGDIFVKIGKKILSALVSCALAVGCAVPALAAPLPGDPGQAAGDEVPVPVDGATADTQATEDATLAPVFDANDVADAPIESAQVSEDARITAAPDANDANANPAIEPTDASNFEYSVDAAGTVEITRYIGEGIADIVVPAAIDGKPVTRIGERAFMRTLPVSLPDVQPLEESVAPSEESLAPLKESLASPEESLALMEEPTELTIIRLDIQSVVFPDSVTQIGKEALRMNVGLRSVTLPASLTEIADGLFWGCTMLQSVTLPQTVTTIGDDAFNGCVALAELVLPAGITQIGDRAFAACASVKRMDLPQGLTQISEDLFSACAMLEAVAIPAGVMQIGDRAFAACPMLKDVVLPDGITQISDGLFSACTSLAAISIPSGVQKIGEEAFAGCVSLGQVDLPVSVTEIDRLAFGGCPSLTKVNYAGSRAQYDAISIAGKELGRGFCALVGADVTFQNTQSVADPNLPEGVQIAAGSPVYTKNQDGRVLIMGYNAVAKSAMPTVQTLIDQFAIPEGMHAVVKYADGLPGIPDGIITTGDVLCFAQADDTDATHPVWQGTVVVMGDVLGQGVMSLSQLIRVTRAYMGNAPLEGVYLTAGDFAGTGRIDLLDLVREAELLLNAMSGNAVSNAAYADSMQ